MVKARLVKKVKKSSSKNHDMVCFHVSCGSTVETIKYYSRDYFFKIRFMFKSHNFILFAYSRFSAAFGQPKNRGQITRNSTAE
jgi:hypothetical protein